MQPVNKKGYWKAFCVTRKPNKKSQKILTHLVNFELKRQKKRELEHGNKKVRKLFNFK